MTHPKAFSEILHAEDCARYTAVYNDGFRGDDVVEPFIRLRWLKKRCRTVEELAACSVFISRLYIPWNMFYNEKRMLRGRA